MLLKNRSIPDNKGAEAVTLSQIVARGVSGDERISFVQAAPTLLPERIKALKLNLVSL